METLNFSLVVRKTHSVERRKIITHTLGNILNVNGDDVVHLLVIPNEITH
jgi:hypothetical protein